MLFDSTYPPPETVKLKTKIGMVHLDGVHYTYRSGPPELVLRTTIWGPFAPSYRVFWFDGELDASGLHLNYCHWNEKGKASEDVVGCVRDAIESYLESDNPCWLKAALLHSLDMSVVMDMQTWEMTKNLNSLLANLRCAKHWTSNFGEPYRGRSAADYSDLIKEVTDFGSRLCNALGATPLEVKATIAKPKPKTKPRTLAAVSSNGHRDASVPLAAAPQR